MAGKEVTVQVAYRVRPHDAGGWTYDLKLLCPGFLEHDRWIIEGQQLASANEASEVSKRAALALGAEAMARMTNTGFSKS